MASRLIASLTVEDDPEHPPPATAGFGGIPPTYTDLFLYAIVPGPWTGLQVVTDGDDPVVIRWRPVRVDGCWTHHLDLAPVPTLILAPDVGDRWPVGTRFILYGR